MVDFVVTKLIFHGKPTDRKLITILLDSLAQCIPNIDDAISNIYT